jgi:hypothetical protein
MDGQMDRETRGQTDQGPLNQDSKDMNEYLFSQF